MRGHKADPCGWINAVSSLGTGAARVSSELSGNEPDFLPAVSSLDIQWPHHRYTTPDRSISYSSSNSVADCYTAVTIMSGKAWPKHHNCVVCQRRIRKGRAPPLTGQYAGLCNKCIRQATRARQPLGAADSNSESDSAGAAVTRPYFWRSYEY